MKSILVLSILLTIDSAVAQTVETQEIEVEARPSIGIQAASERLTGREDTIKESLNMLSGISLGSVSSTPSPRDKFFLRTFSPERFYVYLDEFPLNGSGIRGNFYADLSTLPSQLLRKIEVLYGPSVVYGSNPGGNVVFRTSGFPVERSVGFSSFFGSYDTFGSTFWYENYSGSLGVSLYTGGEKSDGYLRNDFLSREYGSATLYWLIDDTTSLKFLFQRFHVKDGLPVLNTPDIPQSNYDSDYPIVTATYFSLACAPYCKLNLVDKQGENYIDRATTRVGMVLSRDTGNGLFNVSVYTNRSFKEESYYGFFKTPSGVKLTSMEFEGSDDITYGFRITFEEFKVKGLNGTLGTEFQNSGYGDIDKNGLLFVPSNKRALRRGALFGEFTGRLFSLDFRAGLRVEGWSGNSLEGAPDIDGVEFLPALTVSRKINGVQVYAGVGRVYRPPRAEEILWFSKEYGPLSSLGYDYKLDAERGWDYELGVEKGFKSSEFSLRFFRYEMRNYIVSNFEAARGVLNQSFPYRVVENLDYYRLNGVELSASFRPFENLQVLGAYTYQSSKSSNSALTPEETPDPSILVPKHKLTLSVRKQKVISGKDSVTLTGIFYSRRDGYSEDVPGFGVLNLTYAVRPSAHLAFSLKVNNLLNKKYFYVEGYEMPGRNFKLAMDVRF